MLRSWLAEETQWRSSCQWSDQDRLEGEPSLREVMITTSHQAHTRFEAWYGENILAISNVLHKLDREVSALTKTRRNVECQCLAEKAHDVSNNERVTKVRSFNSEIAWQ